MYPLTLRYGIVGTAVAAALPSALLVFISFREAGRIIEESSTRILASLLPGITGSLIMVITIELMRYTFNPLSPVYALASSVILGSLVYIAFLYLTQKEELDEIKQLITA